ncbi:3-ketoacyl-ACP reductase [Clostridia bacterium]|nr:3-ketoacyl-ACP reductase [Clostridia bacterium]
MLKNVLVTGSSRGIGRAVAEIFYESGYKVVVNCKNSADKLEEVRATARFAADVSDYYECVKLVEFAKRETGGIDILVNNAGVPYVGLFQDMNVYDIQRVLNVNLTSVINMSRLVVGDMVSRHKGVIINISSVWGEYGASCEAVYSASKGGVNAFTKALAKELAPAGVRVNAVSCGVIDTEMNAFLSDTEKKDLTEQIPMGRYGRDTEIAETVLFLASDKSAYTTGAVIPVNGGL